MRAQPLQRPRPDLVHRPVGTVDGDPKAIERRTEALADELDVLLGERSLRGLRLRHKGRGLVGAWKEVLDGRFLVVLELAAVMEELHTVVLGWVVRRRDDGAGLLRE